MHASQKLTHTAANILMTSRGEAESAEARARALQRAPREACPFTAIDTFYSRPAGSLGPKSFGLERARRHPPPAIAPAWILLAPIERARRGESLFWASDLLPTAPRRRILHRDAESSTPRSPAPNPQRTVLNPAPPSPPT